jgi:hypothetical protein
MRITLRTEAGPGGSGGGFGPMARVGWTQRKHADSAQVKVNTDEYLRVVMEILLVDATA